MDRVLNRLKPANTPIYPPIIWTIECPIEGHPLNNDLPQLFPIQVSTPFESHNLDT